MLLLPPGASEAEVAAWRREAPGGLVAYGKADLRAAPAGGLAVSGSTGLGIDGLRAAILDAVGYRRAEAVALSSARHREAIDRAVEALERADVALKVSTLEVVAGEIGAVLQVLAEITGEDARTELLDAVFQRFCIGK